MRIVKNSERFLLGSAVGLPLVKSVGSIRSRSASRITWHHHDEFEILFVVDGVTEYEFAGGRRVSLAGGHFLVVPPGTRHRGLDDVRRPARLCGIVFDPRRPNAAKLTPFTRDDLRRLTEAFEGFDGEPRPMSGELRRTVGLLMRQIQDYQTPTTDVAALRLSLCSTLWESARQLTIHQPLQSDEAVHRACEFMREHLGQEVSMNEIARAGGCSRARLFRIFKQSTGQSPNDYFQRLRIAHAAELLSRTDRSITEVALECGFGSSQYFSSVFRKYQGRTPTAFRQASISS